MTDTALYERYKDALRRGHVAALRGRLDAAVLAYTEAAELAPDRALPHASLGGVLLKLERPVDALGAYDAAIARAATDEPALAGRAQALATLGRRVDAAEGLDVLAGLQETAGRLPEACDTARRALELAESRERRRHVEALAQRLRDVPADDTAAAALERALSMLEPVARPPAAPAAPAADEQPPAEPEADVMAEPAPEPEAPALEAIRLTEEAADQLEEGDGPAARNALVAAATAHRAAGNLNAALDACYLALEVAPADAALHLLLARLYVDRGWHGHAGEKLRLLDRLTDLSGDKATRKEVRQLVAALADAADEAAAPG
jgi:tetratricopeptide (TPR) repeat protein